MKKLARLGAISRETKGGRLQCASAPPANWDGITTTAQTCAATGGTCFRLTSLGGNDPRCT